MDANELLKIKAGNIETQRIDFKAPCIWNAATFSKHILAMSNVQNGGSIIIGVQENAGTFEWLGVTDEIKATFKIDQMKDDMTIFADPHVNFNVQIIEISDKEFIAIEVEQFEEIPVICRTDKNGLRAGAIYYRNRNRRVESAAVSNSTDMREIILLAIAQMNKKFRKLELLQLPLSKTDIAKQKLNEELGDL